MERILEFGGKRFHSEVRKLYDMKEVVYDREFLAGAENIELYYMYRNVFLDETDKRIMEENKLRYDITIIPSRNLGEEFVKTAGHYHPFVPGTNITYPEVYEVLEGEAHYLLQKKENDKITDVVLFSAEKNDKVIIPPGYAHVTINPSKKLLKMANWVASDFSSVYEPIKKMHGAAYFETTAGFIKNENYRHLPEIRFLKSREYKNAGLIKDKNMYYIIRDDPKLLEFLIKPSGYKTLFTI
ncbi:MAG: glucose-6-phosphate isomerase family protein [Thermoplasmatales archaeon]|nr:glucose-6-phosphate isomerase family protein [Thermoplasmatales archaeon]